MCLHLGLCAVVFLYVAVILRVNVCHSLALVALHYNWEVLEREALERGVL